MVKRLSTEAVTSKRYCEKGEIIEVVVRQRLTCSLSL